MQKKKPEQQGLSSFVPLRMRTRERKAEEKAKDAWEYKEKPAFAKAAPWGCRWFQKWKEQVEKAVSLGQRLKVVFFPGEVGQGIVGWDELKHVDLWDGKGCGGSQKCEIAYLDKKRKEMLDKGEDGKPWEYDCIDVTHFLKEEFKVGTHVDGF